MFRIAALVTALGLLAVLPSLGGAEVPNANAPAVATGNTRFALDLYGQLKKAKGNLFFSPYSISTALAMTSAGARGETLDQMNRTLHLDPAREKTAAAFHQLITSLNGNGGQRRFELVTANALWAAKQYPIVPAFLAMADADYQAKLQQVDFAGDPEKARLTINRWVEERTRDKIKDLLQSGVVGRDTRLVLTNAIYFKGSWSSPFNENATKKGDFRLPADQKIADVSLMHQLESFSYGEMDDAQVLELPYEGGRLSMVVLLPRQVDGLDALQQKLNPANLAAWLGKLQRNKVDLTLPKFKMTAEFELSKTLSEMGMPLAFTDKADFSGICSSEQLQIGAVVHKAFVDVDEKGTEAAAATAVGVKAATAVAPRPPVVFKADHPFLFLLRDRTTDSVLFMGRVTDPLAK
jgi:serpin B